MNEEINDPVMCEKALSLMTYISDLIYKNYYKFIKSIKIDLIPDGFGQLYVMKIKELSLTTDFVKSEAVFRLVRSSTLKTKEEDKGNSNEKELDFNEAGKGVHEKDARKKEINYKIPLRKPAAQNTNEFLEMIAKAFDRDRKKQENNEIMENKRKILDNNEDLSTQNLRKSFNFTASNEKVNNEIHNIHDLLNYVENTRPKI